MKCERCDHQCILCTGVAPWSEDYWLCETCGSTYVKGDVMEDPTGMTVKVKVTKAIYKAQDTLQRRERRFGRQLIKMMQEWYGKKENEE